jgi:hypothetical protein
MNASGWRSFSKEEKKRDYPYRRAGLPSFSRASTSAVHDNHSLSGFPLVPGLPDVLLSPRRVGGEAFVLAFSTSMDGHRFFASTGKWQSNRRIPVRDRFNADESFKWIFQSESR